MKRESYFHVNRRVDALIIHNEKSDMRCERWWDSQHFVFFTTFFYFILDKFLGLDNG